MPTDAQFAAAAQMELNCPRCRERSTIAESELRRMFPTAESVPASGPQDFTLRRQDQDSATLGADVAASGPRESRSVQRRMALQKGEPVPAFSKPGNEPDEPAAAPPLSLTGLREQPCGSCDGTMRLKWECGNVACGDASYVHGALPASSGLRELVEKGYTEGYEDGFRDALDGKSSLGSKAWEISNAKMELDAALCAATEGKL